MFGNFWLPVGQRLSARVGGWVTGPHKLHALKLDPGVIRRPVESAMLKHLSQEGNDTLGVWKKKIENKTILSPLSDTLNYTGHCGCIYLLYLSMLGRLISSQNRTSHLFICMGDSTTPLGVRLYSQYWSNVFSSSSGVVALEKFRPTTCQGEKIIIQNIQITLESKNMYSKINGNIHSFTSSPKCTIIQVGNHNSSLFILNSLYQNISHSK